MVEVWFLELQHSTCTITVSGDLALRRAWDDLGVVSACRIPTVPGQVVWLDYFNQHYGVVTVHSD